MSAPDHDDRRPGRTGALTAPGGTPFPVDVSRDRRARGEWVVFLAGPILWFTHFIVVYLAVEAGCAGGPGLRVFEPPVADRLTLVATAVAGAGCLAAAVWGFTRARRSRRDRAADAAPELSGPREHWDRGGTLAFAGALLSLLSLVSVLFIGLPALVLPAC